MSCTIRSGARISLSICIAILAGCTRYHSRLLATAPDLVSAPGLIVLPSEIEIPGLAPHPIPTNGLDEASVMMLAVINNPDLKAARQQAGVARAQVLEAGLIPDPQFAVGFAQSALNYGGVLAVSEEIRSILTRGAAKAAARESAQQINLGILWQEVQVAERGRELFIQLRADAMLRTILTSNRDLHQESYDRDHAAMERGDATSAAVAADVTLLDDAEGAIRQLQIEENLGKHQLNALLGLQPDVPLHLIGPIQIQGLSKGELQQALSVLPHRRADLLALQFGYHTQEENLRRSILSQFPSVSAGVEWERDPVEGVNAVGPQVALTLPLFNRNRGQIAIARATRNLLWQQYQAHLDAAVSQADQVWRATQIMAAELKDLDGKLPVLESASSDAEQSLRLNDLNAALYVETRSEFLARKTEEIRLRASLASANAALNVLLGMPMPWR